MLRHKFDQLTQVYPPRPAFTEKDVTDLNGKAGSPMRPSEVNCS